MGERKPVAWIVHTKNRRFVRACWTAEPTDDQVMAAAYDGDIITPLYTRPKPLTDEQITAIFMTYGTGRGYGFNAAVRAVEAALWRDGE